MQRSRNTSFLGDYMKYKEYIYLILMLFLAAINFNVFIKPIHLVCGGTQGLSIIINKLTKIDNSIIILVINIIMFILSIIFLNKKMTLSLVISTFIYPVFIKLTSNFSFSFNVLFFNIIAVGLISGYTNGIIYKFGFSASGINLLGPLIHKYLKIKIGTINFFINIFIISFNLILFGINNLLYSCVVIILNSLVINLILEKNNNIF